MGESKVDSEILKSKKQKPSLMWEGERARVGRAVNLLINYQLPIT